MNEADHIQICRCENVTYGVLRDQINSGCQGLKELKMGTRAGMGQCQGRVCRPVLESLLGADEEGIQPELSDLSIHLPVRPTPMGDFVEGGKPDA